MRLQVWPAVGVGLVGVRALALQSGTAMDEVVEREKKWVEKNRRVERNRSVLVWLEDRMGNRSAADRVEEAVSDE